MKNDETKQDILLPWKCCVSYKQLLETDRIASEHYRNDDYASKTMRDVVTDIIEPICRNTKKPYALHLNPGGLDIGAFISHSWDEPYADFVDSIRHVYQTAVEPPNLWICAFALIQGDEDLVKMQVGTKDLPITDSPFISALKKAKTFVVVRNAKTDLYSRIWCVCELIFAKKFGLVPDKTYVTGPDIFATLHSSVLDAKATKRVDREKVLKVLLNEHNSEAIDKIVHQFRIKDAPRDAPKKPLSRDDPSQAENKEINLEDERCDCLVVLQAAPLVYYDKLSSKFHPIPQPDFDCEKRTLLQSFKDPQDTGYSKVDVVFEPATIDRIGNALEGDISPIVHVSGHGHPDYLAIEKGDGEMQALRPSDLKDFVAAGRARGVKVVFVSACHSKAIGQAFIDAGIPHVVCCSQSEQLNDTAAIQFARDFYRSLAYGNTLQDSFQKARQAIKVSPLISDPHIEMKKFMLLPNKENDDQYHNVPIFFTTRRRGNYQSSQLPRNVLPKPPHIFIGREVNMYEIMKHLTDARLISLTGGPGMGKAALCKAICKYVWMRKHAFLIDDIVWLPPLSTGEEFEDTELSSALQQVYSAIETCETTSGKERALRFSEGLLNLLEGSLLVIDAKNLSSFAVDRLSHFIRFLLDGTENSKLITICRSGESALLHSCSCDARVDLEPLSLRASVILFGSKCRFVSKRHCPTVHTATDLVELLVPPPHADATRIHTSMSKRCANIFAMVGEGVPLDINAAAENMTIDEYEELIRVGFLPEIQLDMKSRAELEASIRQTGDALIAAVLDCDFGQAQNLDDLMGELEKMRERLPSLDDLNAKETKLAAELDTAVSSRKFALASRLVKELESIRISIAKEKAAGLFIEEQKVTAAKTATTASDDGEEVVVTLKDVDVMRSSSTYHPPMVSEKEESMHEREFVQDEQEEAQERQGKQERNRQSYASIAMSSSSSEVRGKEEEDNRILPSSAQDDNDDDDHEEEVIALAVEGKQSSNMEDYERNIGGGMMVEEDAFDIDRIRNGGSGRPARPKRVRPVMVDGKMMSGKAVEKYTSKKGLCPICAETKVNNKVKKGIFKKIVPLTIPDDRHEGEYLVYKGYCLGALCYTLEQAMRELGEISKHASAQQVAKQLKKNKEELIQEQQQRRRRPANGQILDAEVHYANEKTAAAVSPNLNMWNTNNDIDNATTCDTSNQSSLVQGARRFFARRFEPGRDLDDEDDNTYNMEEFYRAPKVRPEPSVGTMDDFRPDRMPGMMGHPSRSSNRRLREPVSYPSDMDPNLRYRLDNDMGPDIVDNENWKHPSSRKPNNREVDLARRGRQLSGRSMYSDHSNQSSNDDRSGQSASRKPYGGSDEDIDNSRRRQTTRQKSTTDIVFDPHKSFSSVNHGNTPNNIDQILGARHPKLGISGETNSFGLQQNPIRRPSTESRPGPDYEIPPSQDRRGSGVSRGSLDGSLPSDLTRRGRQLSGRSMYSDHSNQSRNDDRSRQSALRRPHGGRDEDVDISRRRQTTRQKSTTDIVFDPHKSFSSVNHDNIPDNIDQMLHNVCGEPQEWEKDLEYEVDFRKSIDIMSLQSKGNTKVATTPQASGVREESPAKNNRTEQANSADRRAVKKAPLRPPRSSSSQLSPLFENQNVKSSADGSKVEYTLTSPHLPTFRQMKQYLIHPAEANKLNCYPFSLFISEGLIIDFVVPSSASKAAIVCGTNESCVLQPGKTSGIIGEAGGESLQQDIRNIKPISESRWGPIKCRPGSAVMVGPGKYGKLGVSYVVLASGPSYSSRYPTDLLQSSTCNSGNKSFSQQQKDVSLRSTYRSSLQLCKEEKINVIVFSLLSVENQVIIHAVDEKRRLLHIGLQVMCDFEGYEELSEIHFVSSTTDEFNMLCSIASEDIGLEEFESKVE